MNKIAKENFENNLDHILLDQIKHILLLNIITIGLDTNYNNLQGSSPRVYNTILNSLEKKELCYSVFCDFSKAFDKVWQKGLIHKMNCYGIKGNLLKWFENYVYCRHHKVVNRDSSRSYVSVSAGSPKGLFLIL